MMLQIKGSNAIVKRIAHTMIRCVDRDASIDFYTKVLGMRLHRVVDYDAGRFSLIYLGYEPEENGPAVELTHNWDHNKRYQLGDGYGHIAITMSDMYAEAARIESCGGKITRPPGEMMDSGIHIAFVEDPDGYQIELIQTPFPPVDCAARDNGDV